MAPEGPQSAPAVGLPIAATHAVVSPITGSVMDRISLATRPQIVSLLADRSGPVEPLTKQQVFEFLGNLEAQILQHRDVLLEKTIQETGFIARDSTEIVGGAIEFLHDFEAFVRDHASPHRVIRHSYSSHSHRDMRITDRPLQCIAGIVPQNASLTLGVIMIASALYAGSRIVLRPSLQSACTGALLADIVQKSHAPSSHVAIVNSLASDFLDACMESDNVDLLHYVGSNQYALPVFARAFEAGKVCLLDGQGNGFLYVDESFSPEEAVRIITSGATRFNGETCTSVNGVLIHENLYDRMKNGLVHAFKSLRVGDPRDPQVDVGPLFSAKQALALRTSIFDAAPDGHILCGGDIRAAYFTPAIVEGVRREDAIVREGFFGPAIWIHPVRDGDLWGWLRSNRFPLSDTILSANREQIEAFARQSRAARICVNADPSVESMFEPWGGYPPSGLNPVSVWIDKYRQTFQLDGRLRDILTLCPDNRGLEG